MLFVALSIFCVDGPPLPGKSTFLALRHLGFAPARILDVGANAGHWTRGILRVFPSASVVMVEANEARRQDWRGLPASVRGLISVLSDKEGEVPWFTTPGAATGDSMFQERTSWVATSNMTRHALTLDGLLAREGLADGPFGLIKLDVQGAELTVLRGAARALSQAEVLFMELPLVSARKRTRAWRGTYVHMLHGHAHAHMGSSTRARGIGCAHAAAFGPSRGVRVATRVHLLDLSQPHPSPPFTGRLVQSRSPLLHGEHCGVVRARLGSFRHTRAASPRRQEGGHLLHDTGRFRLRPPGLALLEARAAFHRRVRRSRDGIHEGGRVTQSIDLHDGSQPFATEPERPPKRPVLGKALHKVRSNTPRS